MHRLGLDIKHSKEKLLVEKVEKSKHKQEIPKANPDLPKQIGEKLAKSKPREDGRSEMQEQPPRENQKLEFSSNGCYFYGFNGKYPTYQDIEEACTHKICPSNSTA